MYCENAEFLNKKFTKFGNTAQIKICLTRTAFRKYRYFCIN